MSEMDALREAVQDMVQTDRPSEVEPENGFDADMWRTLAEHGMTRVGTPEEHGGEGGGLQEAAAIIDEASYAVAALPLADTLLVSNWLLPALGVDVSEERVVVALGEDIAVEARATDTTLTGRVPRVAWAAVADKVAVLTAGSNGLQAFVLPVDAVGLSVTPNIAGEPSAEIALSSVAVPSSAVFDVPVSATDVMLRGALARSVQMTGAMRSALVISIAHTSAREQFGRALSKFQAVQQMLAAMANEIAAATAATDGAVRALEGGADATFEIAAAKIRVGTAASTVATLSHHVHGAVGVTSEYPLQLRTRRLWAWREEYGSETYWERQLTSLLAPLTGSQMWDRITN